MKFRNKKTGEIREFNSICINSSLVSAQNRKRLYWCNWNIKQPTDKNIFLKDITFDDSKFSYLRPRGNNPGGLRGVSGKQGCLTSNSWEHNNFIVCMHNLCGGFGEKEHRTFIKKSPTLRTCHFPSLLLSEKAIEYMNRKTKDDRTHWDFKHHSDIKNPKSAAVVANFFKGVPYNVLKDYNCIRKFHPIECERLQTLPDNFTLVTDEKGKQLISNTQRYKAIGNGWTVDVIANIFKKLKDK